MCGLVGLVCKSRNGLTREHVDAFSALLFIDFLRGQDSSGVFLVDNDGDVAIAKEASGSIDFMASEQYESIVRRAIQSGSALVGHNRKATRGDITDENAHPFWVDDDLVLVHNGTMYGDHKKIADVEVDSHAIAYAIRDAGENVVSALESFSAAYALIWYDVKRRKLRMVRNSQRPLWFVETSSAWIWSSEKEMLDFVIKRNKLTTLGAPEELGAGVLQTFALSDRTWQASFEELAFSPSIVTNDDMYEEWASYYMKPEWPDSDRRQWQGPVQRSIPQEPLFKVETNKQEEANNPAYVRRISQRKLVVEFERDLCSRENKVVSLGQYKSQVMKDYAVGSKHYAIGHDYNYANGKDADDGLLLYATMLEEPDLLVRIKINSKNMTEERILQMATGEWVFQVELGSRTWTGFKTGTPLSLEQLKEEGLDTLPGYVVFEGVKYTVVHGGGIVDPKYKEPSLQ